MLSFILLLFVATVIVLIILVLRKNQQKHTKETVDRTAPLPALGENLLPDFAPGPGAIPTDENPTEPTPADTAAAGDPVKAMDNWQLQVKNLRANQQFDDALELCRLQFPKSLAIQQAAIILRQQIKISQEQSVSFEQPLQRLYSLAALADIYGNGTRGEASAAQILAVMQDIRGMYKVLGHQKLKLLNKTDIRLLEQAWGQPDAHRHAEELYPE